MTIKEVRRRDLATHEQDTALHLHVALHALMDLKTTTAESIMTNSLHGYSENEAQL